ncbi:MAG: altronate dehydratase [Verrucomicrobia bacterium]|nr:altronate dehydratase [Verrucomicrobiota bacterium]MCH8511439.1 altronate dehydratase family protein [Kiritimatiellia bacterium]
MTSQSPSSLSSSSPPDGILLHLHPDDQVAVARVRIPAGTPLTGPTGNSLMAGDEIPMSHKIALTAIPKEGEVRKYGQVIGFATRDIAAGDHVHSHNLEMRAFSRDSRIGGDVRKVEYLPADSVPRFMGYERPDGRVGTRNYLAVISSVNCSASVSKQVAAHFNTPAYREKYPHVDGVIALTHKSGCCQQPGAPSDLLERVLMGMARHPNVYGYLIIGLGCEGMQAPGLKERLRENGHEAPTLVIQQTGGIRKTIAAGISALEEMMPQANRMRRGSHPASKLVLAMQCGGSDANSGITANPAVGIAADMLVRCGAAAVLAETPEIYGAEHLLLHRAVSDEVGNHLLDLIHWWEDHARMHGATIDNNPTPGNKAGGLTTIYEKSLGAVAKAGQSPLAAVYRYAQQIDTPGLGFMDSPGYDPVSMTGLAAGGATLGVFTTGRGSVYGCKPMPTLKISTHSPLYSFMGEDMDLNAGTILDGEESIDAVGRRIFERLLEVASGSPTKSEAQGIGDEEFAPWPLGPTF